MPFWDKLREMWDTEKSVKQGSVLLTTDDLFSPMYRAVFPKSEKLKRYIPLEDIAPSYGGCKESVGCATEKIFKKSIDKLKNI